MERFTANPNTKETSRALSGTKQGSVVSKYGRVSEHSAAGGAVSSSCSGPIDGPLDELY